MIRPFTLITMMLAGMSGAYLFAVKHRAQVLDDQLAQTAQQSRLDEQRIRVLQAQWSLETDPTRLARLAAKFSSLQPMKPAQLVTLAALRDVLPAPGSAAPGSNPAAPATDMPAPAVSEAPAAHTLPLPPPEAPLMLAQTPAVPAVKHSPAAPAHLAARQTSHSALHLASSPAVKALRPPEPVYASLRPGQPMVAALIPVKDDAAPQMASGSVLGMAADLAPPQPLSSRGDGN